MEEVKGYKAFNKDLTNRYGKPFTEGGTYSIFGKLQFGPWTLGSYSLVPGVKFEILDRIEDELWTRF